MPDIYLVDEKYHALKYYDIEQR